MSEPQPEPLPPVIPYAQAIRPKPGIVVAVAVMSIVFGAFACLANLCGIVQPISMLVLRSVRMPPAPGGAGAGPGALYAGMSLTPAILASAFSLVDLVLAVYLLTAGILLVRNRASSRRHHLRYAVIKCPVAFFSCLAAGWMQYELQSAVFANMAAAPGSPAMLPSAFPLWIAATSTIFWLAISLAYPIALLVILNRPPVKAFFATLVD